MDHLMDHVIVDHKVDLKFSLWVITNAKNIKLISLSCY